MQSDGKQLSNAILSLDSKGLATSLALLDELSLSKLLFDKARDLAPGTTKSFEHRLQSATEALSAQPHEELVLRMFGKLNEVLGLPPRNYVSQRDLEDNAEDVVKAACEVLRKVDKKFEGNGLSELARRSVSTVLRQLRYEISVAR